jgi:hypothetical protein
MAIWAIPQVLQIMSAIATESIDDLPFSSDQTEGEAYENS